MVSWMERHAEALNGDQQEAQDRLIQTADQRIEDLKRQTSNLTDLRLRDAIDDAEFENRRADLNKNLLIA